MFEMNDIIGKKANVYVIFQYITSAVVPFFTWKVEDSE